jgi:hypothetical protein
MATLENIRTTNFIKVAVNATAGAISSINPVTIKNISAVNSGASRLDQLVDVVANNEIDKSTLVYDAVTDKYVVKPLVFDDITGNLDGGTF